MATVPRTYCDVAAITACIVVVFMVGLPYVFPLLPPLHREPLPQHVHPELRRLPPVQDHLDNVGRQKR